MMNSPVGGVGSRTLILTHIRRREVLSFQSSCRLWRLNDSAFPGRTPFAKRVLLMENEDGFLELSGQNPCSIHAYSWSGGLDDSTQNPVRLQIDPDFQPSALPSAQELSAAASGETIFVLGGGSLDRCLACAFDSLVRIKFTQREGLQVLIPLDLTYQTPDRIDLNAYIHNPNRYADWLAGFNLLKPAGTARYTHLPLRHKIFVDQREVMAGEGDGSGVELHWFTSFTAMFCSSFFPEAHNQGTIDRLVRGAY